MMNPPTSRREASSPSPRNPATATLIGLCLTLLSTIAIRTNCLAGVPQLPGFERRLPAPESSPVAPGPELTPPIEQARALDRGAPVIFEQTADAGPDQSFFLTGERLGKEVFVWGRAAGVSGGEASGVRVLASTTDWLTANLDITAYNGPFLVWYATAPGGRGPFVSTSPKCGGAGRHGPHRARHCVSSDATSRRGRIASRRSSGSPSAAGRGAGSPSEGPASTNCTLCCQRISLMASIRSGCMPGTAVATDGANRWPSKLRQQ